MMPDFRIVIALPLACAASLATRDAAGGPRRMKEVTRALERRPYVARRRVTAKERARQEAEMLAHLEKRLTPGRRKHELRRVEVRLRRVLREEMGVRTPLRLRSVGSELGILAGATPGGTILVADGTENAGRIAALIGGLPRGEMVAGARELLRRTAPDRVAARARAAGTAAVERDALTWLVAHEVGHVLFADGAWPERNRRPIDPPSLERERGFERRADAAGVELAVRAGASPRAILGMVLLLGVMEASGPGRRWFDPHPTPIARYRQVHGRLSALARVRPRLRGELAAMPTPDQVAGQMRAAFGDAMR